MNYFTPLILVGYTLAVGDVILEFLDPPINSRRVHL